MTDRELLERAAKAAGVKIWFDDNGRKWTEGLGRSWNPLEKDGDALTLAVKLRMGIHYETQFIDGKDVEIVEVYYSNDEENHSCKVSVEPIGDNAEAAIRRAIVRAAAEIGKNKGE